MRTVYLAGPIWGCDYGEANDWRDVLSDRLSPLGIRGISPLRCEELVGERYNQGEVDPLFGTDEAIATKNMFDVQKCDMTLAYYPAAITEAAPSIGTIIEIGWAKAFFKPVVLVTDHPRMLVHPVVKACVGWRVKTLEDGFNICAGLLRDYP